MATRQFHLQPERSHGREWSYIAEWVCWLAVKIIGKKLENWKLEKILLWLLFIIYFIFYLFLCCYYYYCYCHCGDAVCCVLRRLRVGRTVRSRQRRRRRPHETPRGSAPLLAYLKNHPSKTAMPSERTIKQSIRRHQTLPPPLFCPLLGDLDRIRRPIRVAYAWPLCINVIPSTS